MTVTRHRITVTQEPRVVREVDDRELEDLDRQGLIYSSESGEYGSHKWPEKVDEDAAAAPEKAAEKKGA
jgi:hypothetical protein